MWLCLQQSVDERLEQAKRVQQVRWVLKDASSERVLIPTSYGIASRRSETDNNSYRPNRDGPGCLASINGLRRILWCLSAVKLSGAVTVPPCIFFASIFYEPHQLLRPSCVLSPPKPIYNSATSSKRSRRAEFARTSGTLVHHSV